MADGEHALELNDPAPTVRSSLRYKEDVRDMAACTERLFALRPVTFRYKSQKEPHAHFGLIAEEVAEVMPELVVRGRDGQIESVAYHELAPMLLNELQKLKARLEALEADYSQTVSIKSGIRWPSGRRSSSVNQGTLLKNLREAMPELVAKFGVQHLDLFGSFARGEAEAGSDVDLLVTFQGEPTFSQFMGLKEYLEARLERRVDILTPEGLKPRIREQVLKSLLHVA